MPILPPSCVTTSNPDGIGAGGGGCLGLDFKDLGDYGYRRC
jgi:hypothetical protein